MFQQVYFHKSTRSAEWMIGAILRRAARACCATASRLPRAAPGAGLDRRRRRALARASTSSSTTRCCSWPSTSGRARACPILADLCRRLRARALFKTIELFREADGSPAHRRPERGAGDGPRDRAGAAGLDPDDLRRARRRLGHALRGRRLAQGDVPQGPRRACPRRCRSCSTASATRPSRACA